MFRKVLVANRGEIAVRVLRALRELGVAGAAVYSDADRDAMHPGFADEAYPLRGVTATETYLDAQKVIAAAWACAADALHPGYGFLSEDGDFAEAVEAAGIRFIGPPAAAMRLVGDKVAARRLAVEEGVPVLPAWEGGAGDIEALAAGAEALGYPLLVKAAAGGGGKGMRRVESRDALNSALESAAREARNAFGDDRVYQERYLPGPRHVEVQVFLDDEGEAVHLFERECSLQRRHQKVVEESPSTAVSEGLRAQLGDAALRVARAAGYRNAGTVEFLLDEVGAFYFMEVNARLQVEHPVTELVTGLDLVQAQIRIAAGEPLPFKPEGIRQQGHALECRVYAEDPGRGHLPGSGTVQAYREPGGPGVRVDSGVREGDAVTVHYDPLLAKVIVWGADRAASLARMDRALAEFVVLGVPTNLSYLRQVLRHPDFVAGRLHTQFLDEIAVPDAQRPPPAALAAAALALRREPSRSRGDGLSTGAGASPWLDGGAWRL